VDAFQAAMNEFLVTHSIPFTSPSFFSSYYHFVLNPMKKTRLFHSTNFFTNAFFCGVLHWHIYKSLIVLPRVPVLARFGCPNRTRRNVGRLPCE
jgi:hypothetical protein